MGIVQHWLELGQPFHEISVHAFGKHLTTIPLAGIDGNPKSGPLDIGQNVTERLLAEHLATLGLAVERPVEVTAIREDADGVSVTLRHPDGRDETAEATYLIGCEGSNSLTRQAANVPYEGKRNMGIEFLQTNSLVRSAYPPGRGYLFITAKQLIGMFPLDAHGRFRVLCARTDSNPDDRSDPTLEEMQDIVREVVDAEAILSDPHWLNRFRTQHRVASRFRPTSRTFIAGDAAHVHVPVAGQGMNTGMQDAFNLAWKLAYVHRGWAPAALLDTYNAERQPNAETLIRFTDTMFRNAIKPPSLVGLGIRALGRPVLSRRLVQQRFRAKIAEVDIHYRKGPLSRQIGRVHGPNAGDRLPDARVVRASDRAPTRLHETLRGLNWTMLVMTGGGRLSRQDLAALDLTRYERVHSIVVSRDVDTAAQLGWTGDVLLDPDGDAHAGLGAAQACILVVRPDWYVGFRGPLASGQAARDYLGSMLLMHPAAGAA